MLKNGDFPGGPGDKNLPAKSGDMDRFDPRCRTIPRATTTEPTRCNF